MLEHSIFILFVLIDEHGVKKQIFINNYERFNMKFIFYSLFFFMAYFAQAKANTYELSLDVGGTSTKFAYRMHGEEQWEEIGSIAGNDHADLFCEPELVAQKLKTYFKNRGIEEIKNIAMSMTGIVDHDSQVVVNSNFLRKISKNRYKFPFSFIPQMTRVFGNDSNFKILNDSIASAIGNALVGEYGLSSDIVKTPVLVITLGTGVAISVIDEESDKYVVFGAESWIPRLERIGTDKGKSLVHVALSNTQLKSLDQRRKSLRVGRGIGSILSKYFKTFVFQPHTIILGGGNSVGLDTSAIFEGLAIFKNSNSDKNKNISDSPNIMVPASYKQQSENQLNGAMRYLYDTQSEQIDVKILRH